MPSLRREQFEGLAKRLTEPNNGFSIHTETGKEPTSGYMVSQRGTEQAIPPHEEATPEHLENYVQVHQTELAQRAKYFGGWHDPDSHEKDLDISKRYANSETGHKVARVAMMKNDQKSLYDLNKGEYGTTEWNHLKVGFPNVRPIGGQRRLDPAETWRGVHANLNARRPR